MKIMRCVAGLICLSIFFLFPSCNKSTVTVPLGNWVHRGDFPGVPRSGAFSFTIGNKAFIGMGFNGNGLVHYVRDCHSFDMEGGIWNDMAPFPGEPREKAVAFSINGKGYVGTGYNRDSSEVKYIQLKDFWEYDPATDQWKQLNDFGGTARYNAVGFSNNKFGFVGTGFDGTYFNDFWRYDPANDSWKKITTYDGEKRQQASTMEIDGKFYLLAGYNNNSYIKDIWKFDPDAPENSAWTNVTPLTTDPQFGNFIAAVQRYDAVGFGLNGLGYIATGVAGSAQNSIYQYDPVGLTWTKMTPFERAPRSQAVAVVIGGRAFVGTGVNGSSRFDDMMEFQPTADYNQND